MFISTYGLYKENPIDKHNTKQNPGTKIILNEKKKVFTNNTE